MDTRYEKFLEFYKMNYKIIRKMASYYNLTFDELVQEAALAYFTVVDSCDTQQEFTRAFERTIKNSMVDFSATGRQIDRNSAYESEKRAIEKAFNSFEVVVAPEQVIILSLEIEMLKSKFGEDTIDNLLDYYMLGMRTYSKKNKMSTGGARNKVNRLINKIRLEGGY
ncbi:MAG: hypothetical protein ACRC0F_01855 [Cetobacterium sp.]